MRYPAVKQNTGYVSADPSDDDRKGDVAVKNNLNLISI